MLGNDQVEVLAERLGSTVAKQRCCTLIPPPDRPRIRFAEPALMTVARRWDNGPR
jgi:hypothetical protein